MQLRTLVCAAALVGCAGGNSLGSTIISPAEFGKVEPFSEAELKEQVVVRNLRDTPEASFQVVRMRDRLGARVHNGSDVVVMVVSGRVQVVLGKDSFNLTNGNVIEVPRGVTYELVNRDPSASLVYMVYTPTLSAEDVKLIKEAPRESAWQWNLWTQ